MFFERVENSIKRLKLMQSLPHHSFEEIKHEMNLILKKFDELMFKEG